MLAILPLSPVRECALSRNFIPSDLLVEDIRLNIVSRNENGSDSDLLSHPYPHSPSTGGTIGIERFHLVANAFSICACFRSCCEAEANFWGISPVWSNRLRKGIVVQRIDSY